MKFTLVQNNKMTMSITCYESNSKTTHQNILSVESLKISEIAKL